MTLYALVLRYAAFAIIATIVNLGTQRAVLAMNEQGFAYFVALVAGTLVGLAVKYILDKRWIFADASRGIAAHSRKFSLYTLMGVATTLIFWGTETIFWLVEQTQVAREAGAVLGLAIGYAIKYQLDRRYVFIDSAGRAA